MVRALLVLLVTFSALAQDPTQTVKGKLAYYGENFAPNGDVKAQLAQILAAKHGSQSGQFDQVGSCGNTGSCYQHTAVGYSRARIIMFGDLFMEKDQSGTFVTEVYCNQKIYFRSASDISNMSNVVNIEHTWPQSKFNSAFGKETQKSDLHHLFPSDSKANGVRGNNPFGTAKLAGFMGADLCAPSDINTDGGDLTFTPPAGHRGNVARALFYFATRYDMTIDARQEKTLRQWHKEDPVDADEMVRNNKIAKYQFTRNPYIDFPELVDRVQDF